MGSRATHRIRLVPAAARPGTPAPAPGRGRGRVHGGRPPGARRRPLAAGVGGDVVAEDAHAFAVRGSALGDLAVELDLRYAHPQRHGMTLPVRIEPRAAAGLGWLVSGAVPRELIVPPLPADRLAEVDRILGLLRGAGAHGRGATVFGSLGLHFNIDAPAADLPRITAVMLAFGLMESRLRREIAQGQRRLERHLAAALPAGVPAPDRGAGLPARPAAQLVDDYLAANPTRDRGLDLLPLLLGLDPARVRAKLPYEKIAARPVFHFRLPQAHPGESGWSIAADWNRWVAVERLAADEERSGRGGAGVSRRGGGLGRRERRRLRTAALPG